MQKDEGKKPEDKEPNPNKRRRSWNGGTKNNSSAIKKKKKAPTQRQKTKRPNQLGFFTSAQVVPSLQGLQTENRKRTKRHYSTVRQGGPSNQQHQRRRTRNQSKTDLKTPRPTPGSVPDAPKGQSRYAMPSADPLETPTVALQQQQQQGGGNSAIGTLPPGVSVGGIVNAQNQQQATGLDLYGTNEGLILLHDDSEEDDDDFASSLEEDDEDEDEEVDNDHHDRHQRRRRHQYHHEAVQSGAIGDEHNPTSDQYDDEDDEEEDDDDDVGNGNNGGMEVVSPGGKHKRIRGRKIPPAIRARFAQYDAILAQWGDENLRMKERLELVEAELAGRRLDGGGASVGGGGEQREQQGGDGGVLITNATNHNTGTEAELLATDVGKDNDNDNNTKQ